MSRWFSPLRISENQRYPTLIFVLLGWRYLQLPPSLPMNQWNYAKRALAVRSPTVAPCKLGKLSAVRKPVREYLKCVLSVTFEQSQPSTRQMTPEYVRIKNWSSFFGDVPNTTSCWFLLTKNLASWRSSFECTKSTVNVRHFTCIPVNTGSHQLYIYRRANGPSLDVDATFTSVRRLSFPVNVSKSLIHEIVRRRNFVWRCLLSIIPKFLKISNYCRTFDLAHIVSPDYCSGQQPLWVASQWNGANKIFRD